MVKSIIIVSAVALLMFSIFLLSSKKSDGITVEVILPLGFTIRLKRESLPGKRKMRDHSSPQKRQ